VTGSIDACLLVMKVPWMTLRRVIRDRWHWRVLAGHEGAMDDSSESHPWPV